MGQVAPNPLSDQLTDYEKIQYHEKSNTTIWVNKAKNCERLLKKLIFNDFATHEKSQKLHKERLQFKSQNIEKLIKHSSLVEKICISCKSYEFHVLWEYHSTTLADEIKRRARSGEHFTEKQMLTLIEGFAAALLQFQTKNVIHQKISVETIKLNEEGKLIVSDPLSLDEEPNFTRVYSKHETNRIYLSPEECNALQMGNFCVKSSKNDVWTCGMILLEVGLLQDQNSCYKERCRKIDLVRISENIQRLGKFYSQNLKKIVQTMLIKNRNDRPSWQQLQQKLNTLKNNEVKPLTQIIPSNRISPEVFPYQNPLQKHPSNLIFTKNSLAYPIPIAHNQHQNYLKPPVQPQVAFNYIDPRIPIVIANKQDFDIKNVESKLSPINHLNHSSSYHKPQPFVFGTKSITKQPFVPPCNITVSKLHCPGSMKKFTSSTSKIGYLFEAIPISNKSLIQQCKIGNIQFEYGRKIEQTQQKPQSVSGNNRFTNPSIKNAESLTDEGDFNKTLAIQFRNQDINKSNPIGPNISEIVYEEPKEDTIQLNEKEQDPKQNIEDLEYVVQNFKVGSRYQGYKFKNMRHGHGKFYYQDGGMYNGHWSYNKMDGKGKLHYQSGTLAYDGNWKNDQFEGRGKLDNQNPELLQANFDYTDFNNVGEYWKYYQGEFVEGMKQGRGKLMLTNDEYFIGSFQQDMIEGNGKFFAKNGVVKGIWQANKLIKIE